MSENRDLTQAWSLEKRGRLVKAEAAYSRLLRRKSTSLALSIACREGLNRCRDLRSAFRLDRAELWRRLKSDFPDLTRERFANWDRTGCLLARRIDGEKRYDAMIPRNIAWRDAWAREQNPDFQQQLEGYHTTIWPWVEEAKTAPAAWKPYRLTLGVTIRREDLPRGNTVRIWVPFPLQTAQIGDISIASVRPQGALKMAPRPDASLGSAYMEVSRPSSGDVRASITVSLMSRPNVVPVPRRPGEIDPDASFCSDYTRSTQHQRVSPRVTELAAELTSGAKTPWEKARRIYDHLLATVPYGWNWHWRSAIFSPYGSASQSVLGTGFGDCVTQSCLFVALCRAVGIPARVTGGRFLCANDHYWAEFFEPSRGWVPVDPTIPNALMMAPGLSRRQINAVRDFYFGGLESLRLTMHREQLAPPLDPPKRSERRRSAFLSTFAEAECGGRNVERSTLTVRYKPI
ncbi:MAG: transglutaminase-like domain-containing protein [Candidatus Latescibacteria bacterium]|nr:transglutaminase-like domain-containing protein [Candidatus Latescibacterota bacterium]